MARQINILAKDILGKSKQNRQLGKERWWWIQEVQKILGERNYHIHIEKIITMVKTLKMYDIKMSSKQGS